MVARLFRHLYGRILQVDVITDRILLRKHRLVAALRIFGCKLALMLLVWISFLRDVVKIDCGKLLLNFCLPSARHLFRRIYKLQVIDHLKGIVLRSSQLFRWCVALKVLVASDASRVVIF